MSWAISFPTLSVREIFLFFMVIGWFATSLTAKIYMALVALSDEGFVRTSQIASIFSLAFWVMIMMWVSPGELFKFLSTKTDAENLMALVAFIALPLVDIFNFFFPRLARNGNGSGR